MSDKAAVKVELGYEWDGNGVPPIVEVTWVDTTSYSEWRKVKKAFELEASEVITVGYLLEWTESCVRISGSRSMENGMVSELGNTDVIPAGWVQKVTVLRNA